MEHLGDAALVFAIARFEQDALQEAYRRHGGAVMALAKRVLSETALAEDIVQDVFVRLWFEPHKFDPDRGSLRPYLLAQAHGRSIDLIRSRTARQRREEKDERQKVVYMAERSPFEAVVAADEVKGALADLPEDERTAIELAYFGGKTYREVAAALQEAEGTIKSRIRSGLRKMRSCLAEGELSQA